MSELTKEKIYKKELEKVGGEGNNNLERIRSLAGSGTIVIANPELSGDEADLTGLQVGDTKYAVPQGSGSNVYVCNFLEDTSSTTLTNEQVTEFITNITNPNVISKFSRLNSSFENISIISVSTEIDAESGEPYIYFCWGFFNNYYYSVSLNIKTNNMEIEQP